MEWIEHFILVLLLKQVSPAIVSTNLTTGAPSTTTTLKNEDLNTNKTYAVTENIIDVPDDRTLQPILTNFTVTRPLNLGNNTLLTNNNANNNEEKGDENNNNHEDGKLKKNSFSILHIKGEFESHKPEKEHNHRNVLSQLFGDLKDHVYSWKRGVVDGLHSFFHRHDADDDDGNKPFKPVKESRFPNHHHKFHRKFHDVEGFGHHSDYDDDDYNDSSEEHYDHF